MRNHLAQPNNTKFMWTGLIPLAIILLTACTSTPIQVNDPYQSASPTPMSAFPQPADILIPTEVPPMLPSKPTPSSQSAKLVEMAKIDLAGRLAIPTDQIILIDARAVIWSDSSLGCPQPGMLYADVLTPGYLILLQADGQDFEYHAGKSLDVFLCKNPIPPVPGMPGDV